MPFKSKAQMRLFARDPKLRKYFKEWLDATPNPEGLPEKVAMDKDMIMKMALSVLMDKESAVRKGAFKRRGKSLTKLKRDMNRTDSKQNTSDS